MKGWDSNTWHIGIIGCGVLIILSLLQYLGQTGSTFRPLDRLENFTYDWRTRLVASQSDNVSTNLAVIFIDDKSAGKMDKGVLKSPRFGALKYGFPFPRFIHGDFLQVLKDYGAALVCYDIFFVETHRDTHPSFNMLNGEPSRTDEGEFLHSDDIFADDMLESGNVVLAMNESVLPNVMFRENAKTLGHISADPDFDGILRRIKPFQDGMIWHEIFENSISQLAGYPLSEAIISKDSIYWEEEDMETGAVVRAFEMKLDEDGNFDVLDPALDFGAATSDQIIQYFGNQRFHKPFEIERFWHMGFVMAAESLKLNLPQTKILKSQSQLEIPAEDGKKYIFPLDEEGFFIIPWRFDVNEPKLTRASLSDFFELDREGQDAEVFLEQWEDKVILVGSNATGNNLRDITSTPLQVNDFAMMTHFNVANALLENQFIRTLPGYSKIILVVIAVILAGLLSLKLQAPYDSAMILLVAVVYVGLAILAFVSFNLWIPIALPIAGGLGMTHILAVANRALTEQKEKSHIRKVFGQTVSPNVVSVLLKEDTSELKGTTENITTIFSDIRGFTDITDSLESRAIEYAQSIGLANDQVEAFAELQTRTMLKAVNENLSIQAESIKIYNGTLDKYIGDCVMAFWGAPSKDDLHALQCVRSTIASQKAMHQLNVRREEVNRRLVIENEERIKNGIIPIPLNPLLDMGAGINSGKAIVGLVGSTSHISNYTVFGRAINLAARLESISGRGRVRIGETTKNMLIEAKPEFKEWLIEHPPTALKGFSKPIPTFEVCWWLVPDTWAPAPEIPLDLA